MEKEQDNLKAFLEKYDVANIKKPSNEFSKILLKIEKIPKFNFFNWRFVLAGVTSVAIAIIATTTFFLWQPRAKLSDNELSAFLDNSYQYFDETVSYAELDYSAFIE